MLARCALAMPLLASFAIAQEVPVAPGFGQGSIPGVDAQIIITEPGSYYLTESFVVPDQNHGIYIHARRVTLDLRGLSILGEENSFAGVYVASANGAPRPSIVIQNGSIAGMGATGVFAFTAANSTLRNLHVTGCVGDGIRLGQGLIEDCHARGNQSDGISVVGASVVRDCTATKNRVGFRSGQPEIFLPPAPPVPGPPVGGESTTFQSCVAMENADAGFRSGAGTILADCAAHAHSDEGFLLGYASLARDCSATGNAIGIKTNNGVRVEGCTLAANVSGIEVAGRGCIIRGNTLDMQFGTTGIHVAATVGGFDLDPNRGSVIEANTISFLPSIGAPITIGIHVEDQQNLIVRNTVLGAATPFDIALGNSLGPVWLLGAPITASTPALANFRN